MSAEVRPAFYALRSGGWRDYVTLLHPPYTLWHLSYVAIGAGLAPHMKWGLLGWTTLAFLLAMGIGAHALDELKGRPLQTQIPAQVLVALAVASIAGASAIGLVVAFDTTLWLIAFVAFGAIVVVAYNLELLGGAIHTSVMFAFAWGAFPVLTAYFASAHRLRGDALAAAVFAFLTSYAQRVLSTPVRFARRNIGDPELARSSEIGLKLLAAAMPLLAAALLLARVP
ncbi:MAG TPA: hypothetical protein VKP14_06580 [Gaiellaceae bacterium]|nr:hypothetical protein [Gaiellaceae bacterium]